MKTIGLLGGMSWESSAIYYQLLNAGIKQHLGGLHSAQISMHSVNFAQIEHLQHAGKWDELGQILGRAAQSIEAGGADFLIIATNTMHKVADHIQEAINIPLLHIADATAERLKAQNITKVGLLGTKFTMEQEFYKGRLRENHGIEVIVPNESQRLTVHYAIYDELCKGIISHISRGAYVNIIENLHTRGAEAVILGCTEITMLVGPKDTEIPLFDTTAIHTQAAVKYALTQTS